MSSCRRRCSVAVDQERLGVAAPWRGRRSLIHLQLPPYRLCRRSPEPSQGFLAGYISHVQELAHPNEVWYKLGSHPLKSEPPSRTDWRPARPESYSLRLLEARSVP